MVKYMKQHIKRILLLLSTTVLSTTLLLLIVGCGASVRTYTFEVERPDQEMSGNRGYLRGELPPAERTEKPKRTIVGVDIELPTREEFIEETGLKRWKKP